MTTQTFPSVRANALPPVSRQAAPARGLAAPFGTGILVLVAAACAPVPDDDQGSPGAVAVTNATIIDGLGGAPIPDGVVIAEGDRIVAVGPAAEVTVPDGATIVDAAGGAVMPGLADMHVHMVGGWDGVSTEMLGYRRYLNALLHAGVTTVFDAGNVLPFIQQIQAEIEAGRLPGPRVYMAGPLVDGPVPIWPPITYFTFEASAMWRHASQLSAAGVDALKGYAGLDAEMVDSLVQAGAEFGLPVIVDLGSRGDYAAAVEAGVLARAHAPSGPLSDDEIAAMVEHGTATITTLAVLESFARRRLNDLEFLDHPLIAATTPPWFLEALREHATRTLSDAEVGFVASIEERLMTAMTNVKRLSDAGVPLVAGTDAPYPGVFQGEGIHRELELLVEAGLTPLQAITVATHNAARLMDASDEWGAIAPGMAADMLVVRGNPAENIGATRDILAVIQRGVVLDRSQLVFSALDDLGFRTVGSVAAN
ncbi:MAG: amidohydrolase family protein [Gemmatimonadota bacterium]|nr:amidohydrolase family protein [Gemmatimonadota bacterium]MDE2865377.1 amidohydrolase family protein [Gemmatimonadota bacterium]MYB06322.1 amidohydrolase family protein [Gemmatimonadota bacterium]MYG21353.1 amidohydrolase family protein [Gemmatimonadota bacterium]MYJ40705.1 amidohydrolase family protein [Gemmatimonadota bacterium]